MNGCDDARTMITRRVDGLAESANERETLDAHLHACAECRALLDEQQAVAAILRSRPVQPPSADFARRLTTRLNTASGWLGIADFRVWTFRLAPLAAALAVAAFLAATDSTQQSALSLSEWARGEVESPLPESMLWQDVSEESLLETLVTGRAPSNSGSTNVQ